MTTGGYNKRREWIMSKFKELLQTQEDTITQRIKSLEQRQWEIEEEINTLKQQLDDYGAIISEVIVDEG